MEKSTDKKTSIPQTSTLELVKLPLPLKSFFGYNKYKKTVNSQAVDEEKAQNNLDMIIQEIESLQMILNDREIQVYDTIDSETIECVDDNERTKLLKLIKLSLVPKIPEGTKF